MKSRFKTFDLLKKRSNRPQIESLVLSPTTAKQSLILNLIAVSASFRLEILYQSLWNFLINPSEVVFR